MASCDMYCIGKSLLKHSLNNYLAKVLKVSNFNLFLKCAKGRVTNTAAILACLAGKLTAAVLTAGVIQFDPSFYTCSNLIHFILRPPVIFLDALPKLFCVLGIIFVRYSSKTSKSLMFGQLWSVLTEFIYVTQTHKAKLGRTVYRCLDIFLSVYCFTVRRRLNNKVHPTVMLQQDQLNNSCFSTVTLRQNSNPNMFYRVPASLAPKQTTQPLPIINTLFSMDGEILARIGRTLKMNMLFVVLIFGIVPCAGLQVSYLFLFKENAPSTFHAILRLSFPFKAFLSMIYYCMTINYINAI